MNAILSGKKKLSAFALVVGARLLCACPRVDPVDPVGPEGPDGPEVPEKPYYNLMTSSGTLYRLSGKLIGALGEFGDTAVRYNNTIGPIPYFY